jgi:hypothetical protein
LTVHADQQHVAAQGGLPAPAQLPQSRRQHRGPRIVRQALRDPVLVEIHGVSLTLHVAVAAVIEQAAPDLLAQGDCGDGHGDDLDRSEGVGGD